MAVTLPILDVLSGNGFDPSMLEGELRLSGLGLAVEGGHGELDGAVFLWDGVEAAGDELEDDVAVGALELAEADVGGVAIGDARGSRCGPARSFFGRRLGGACIGHYGNRAVHRRDAGRLDVLELVEVSRPVDELGVCVAIAGADHRRTETGDEPRCHELVRAFVSVYR